LGDRFIAYLGVAAGTVSGVLEARRKRMDVVGRWRWPSSRRWAAAHCAICCWGVHRCFWIHEEGYAYSPYSWRWRSSIPPALLPVGAFDPDADALGSGVFTVLGVEYGLQDGTSWFIASLMGVITGVFGGVLRDVICNELPSLFSKNTYLYATCSLLGAWVYILLTQVGGLEAAALPLAVAVIFALRLAAVALQPVAA
jgi:uncharacterized membrane protein YeiH